ncbi:MAG: hypothetical protein RBS38_13055, partial [Bacteroidales bacterium]|nr:hypothetical protein [Bacteroidales bacterium]
MVVVFIAAFVFSFAVGFIGKSCFKADLVFNSTVDFSEKVDFRLLWFSALPSASAGKLASGLLWFSALPSASAGKLASELALFSALPSASADGRRLFFAVGL